MTERPILVTGPTGKTGTHVVRLLFERGFSIRAFVLPGDPKADHLRQGPIEVVEGDLLDIQSLRGALDSVRRAYFCFPPEQRLLEATTTFAMAAKQAGLEVLVNLSQLHASPDHLSALTRQHWFAERVLDCAGIGATHLRASLFAEQYLEFTSDTVPLAGLIWLPLGEGRLAPVTCEDVARVAVAILAEPEGHAGHGYPITGGRSFSQHELAEVFEDILGRTVEYKDAPDDLWRFVATQQGYPSFLVDHLLHAAEDIRAGRLDRTSDAVQELGGHPPRSLVDFLRENASVLAPRNARQRARFRLQMVFQMLQFLIRYRRLPTPSRR